MVSFLEPVRSLANTLRLRSEQPSITMCSTIWIPGWINEFSLDPLLRDESDLKEEFFRLVDDINLYRSLIEEKYHSQFLNNLEEADKEMEQLLEGQRRKNEALRAEEEALFNQFFEEEVQRQKKRYDF